jgi:hypothetical protein
MTTVDTLDRARAQDVIAADPILSLVHAYVEQRRAGRAMAALADIDFFAMPKAVPNLFTMAVIGSPPRFRYKFAGTQVDAILAYNAMGHYLDEIYPHPEHKIIESYRQFASDRRPQLLRASFTSAEGLPRVVFRYIFPLSDDGQRLSHVLGVLVMRRAETKPDTLPPPMRPSAMQVDYV